jgi:pimeloyl-ACP methyl ester carboxylesterase
VFGSTARCAAAAAAALLLAACGGGGDEPEPFAVPALGGSAVDVGGHVLYFECAGSGSPTVVLEAGFRGGTRDWRDVQPHVARITRVCAYDRAGLHGSPAPEVERTRTTQTEVDDLKRLLEYADIEGPYVLVGHSYGGAIVRLFAGEHRDDVVGVVLVDSSHPDYDRRVAVAVSRLSAGDPAGSELRSAFQVLPPIVDGLDTRRSAAQVRAVGSLGAVPLVVLTSGDRRWLVNVPAVTVPDDVAREVGRLWLDAQRELADLSSNQVHAVASASGHSIQSRLTGQPQVVEAAIEAVIASARTRTRLPPCRRLFPRAAVVCLDPP